MYLIQYKNVYNLTDPFAIGPQTIQGVSLMLESTRSKSKPSEDVVSLSKTLSYKTMMKEPDIRFFYRFVSRYGIREKALAVLAAKLREQRAH